MKKLLIAAALVFAPTTSQAAVTINFTGATFPYDADNDGVGSYQVVTTPTEITRTIDTAAQAVSGSIVIDTAKAVNTGTGGAAQYSGKSFLTLTFTSSGITPTVLKGSLSEQAIDSEDGSLTFQLFDAADTYAYAFRLFSLDPIPTSIFDGILLPDFTMADNLFFVAVSSQQMGDTSTLRVSSGVIDSITQSVPEPATWAMMLVGFGLIGTALRRRERITVRFA